MHIARAVSIGVLGLAVAVVVGNAQEGQAPRQVIPAIEAVIGNFLFSPDGERGSLTVGEYRSAYYPSLRFFRGEAHRGDHSTAYGLAVELPDGAVVPLASAPMRRLISGLAQVNTDDTTSLARYATELLMMEGHIAMNAQLVQNLEVLPDDARLRAVELGIIVHAPKTRPIGGSPSRRRELVFWLAQENLLIRAAVVIAEERFRDHVVAVDPVMAF